MLKVITFNAAILDVRILGHSFHRPVNYIDARLDALASALQHSAADLVFLQELFHRDKQDHLCQMLKKQYPYVNGLAPAGWKLRLGNELLTLSRFPLPSGRLVRFNNAPAEELRHTSKGFYHMITELPDLGKVNLINFHMSAGGKKEHPESKQMEAIRARQIQQVIEYASGLDKTILAGDLNAGTEISTRNYQQLISAGFYDLFAAHGSTGISWDPANPLVIQGRESQLPAQRIDHIFTDKALFNGLRIVEAKVIFTEHSVTTDIGKIPLSDHYGLAVDIATQ